MYRDTLQQLEAYTDRLIQKVAARKSIERMLTDPGAITEQDVARLVRTIGVVSTRECNLACENCYEHVGTPRRKGLIMGIENFLPILSEAPYADISIGGGEPFVYPKENVDLALALHNLGRNVSFATNGLVFTDEQYGMSAVQELQRIPKNARPAVTIGFSFDLMHAAGDENLHIEDYVNRMIQAIVAMRQLGFRVTTNSVISGEEDLGFYWDYVLPMRTGGATHMASVSPNMYDPETIPIVAEIVQQGLCDGPTSVAMHEMQKRMDDAPLLRVAPWTIVQLEIKSRSGHVVVNGPSPYISDGAKRYGSIIDMFRSTDWKEIIADHPLEMTGLQAALPYKVGPGNEVKISLGYLAQQTRQKITQLAYRFPLWNLS